MFYQLIKYHKEQLFATFNHQLEIKVHTQDAQELMQLLSDILMMEAELELDCLQDQEKLSPEVAELLLELLQVEEEIKSLL
jgi:hypothetical protein